MIKGAGLNSQLKCMLRMNVPDRATAIAKLNYIKRYGADELSSKLSNLLEIPLLRVGFTITYSYFEGQVKCIFLWALDPGFFQCEILCYCVVIY
jgi:hypothetical protein